MFRTPPRRERNGLILLSSFYFLRQSRYHSGNTCNCQHSSCICFVSGLNRHSFLRDFAVIVLIYGIFLLEYLSYFFCLFSRFFISFCLGSCFLRFLTVRARCCRCPVQPLASASAPSAPRGGFHFPPGSSQSAPWPPPYSGKNCLSLLKLHILRSRDCWSRWPEPPEFR